MKNKLTINKLAVGNLKARKKQYTIMIIGIILAMVFSSSVVLFMFSAKETSQQICKEKYGCQSGMITSQNLTEKEYNKAIKDGYITEYHLMHHIGYGYAKEGMEYLGASVTWMDEGAWDLYYLKFLDGGYPKADNEVAIEQTALSRLGYKDAKIGDTIKFKMQVRNSDEIVDKEYKLVGIVNDRKTNVEERYSDYTNGYDTLIPAIYVAKNTPVEAGGKEDLVAIYSSDYTKEFVNPDDNTDKWSKFSAPHGYLQWLADDSNIQIRSMGYKDFVHSSASLDALFTGGDMMAIIIIALIFASCVAIVNAFNTNLKERKKQIGMMRAVGTTRRQIIKIYGREALIISLIATPISVALSYIIVSIIIRFFSENAVMSKSLIALLISAVVNVIVVMGASLIPLFIASRITPMQAIRNVNVNRKAKKKKIKSKMQFNASNHLASRTTKFYKGSLVTVSILLTITICFSSLAFSFITYSYQNMRQYPFDYTISSHIYDDNIRSGISEIDKQSIEALPYVERAYGGKRVSCEIETDEINNFVRIVDSNRYEYILDEEGLCEQPKSVDEVRKNITTNQPDGDYYEKKEALGVKKEMFGATIESYDTDVIAKAEECVAEGKIDYDKLRNGEEIILVCPEKTEFIAKVGKHSYGAWAQFDEKVGKYPMGYSSVLTGESEYKVGDEITFHVSETVDENIVDQIINNGVVSVEYDDEGEEKMVTKPYATATVRIGAIIRPNSLDYYKNGLSVYDLTIITSNEGMNRLVKGLNYSNVSFNANTPVDADTDAKICDDMTTYTEKYASYLLSSYQEEEYQVKENKAILMSVIALIVIGFVICISIINNSISGQIRENKRVIGTLRAVGADRGDLVKSYIRQMLTMFGWGTGIGYGLFLAIFFIVKFISGKNPDGHFEFIFNPWVTLAMTVFAFAVCAINVFTKIKKEMYNSIVENIREL